MAVLVGDQGVCRGDAHGAAPFGVAGGVGQAACHAVGVDRGCPDVGDGAGGAGRACGAAGAGAVGDGDGDGACTGVGAGVGVLVGDGLDDVLVLGMRAGAADADAGGAAASDGDGAQRALDSGAGCGQGFVGGAKQVVGGSGGDGYRG